MNLTRTKKVPGYDDYVVSRRGVVYSYKSGKAKRMTPFLNNKGYLRVQLFKNGVYETFLVHRLVGTLFVPNPKKKPQINHDDFNKVNNKWSNLTWMTNRENQKHNRKKPFANSDNGVHCPF